MGAECSLCSGNDAQLYRQAVATFVVEVKSLCESSERELSFEAPKPENIRLPP